MQLWDTKGTAAARAKSGSPHQPPSPSLPAVLLQLLRLIGAVEESAFEELHSNDGKNEHEEHVNDEDIEDVLQGIHHAVEDSLGTEENKVQGWKGKRSASNVLASGIELHWGGITQPITQGWFHGLAHRAFDQESCSGGEN